MASISMVDAAVGQVITQNIFPNPVKTLCD